jgi:stage II sporulation protein D
LFQEIWCYTKNEKLRIGLITDVKTIEIGLSSKGEIYIEENNNKIRKFNLNDRVKIRSVGFKKISFLGKTYRLPVKFASSEKILINNRYYDGEIELVATKDNKFTVINLLTLEQYLYGVVPYEIDSDWTDEMIKVQAIIARTYAVASKPRHQNDGFDFCSTVHCQVYRGINFKVYSRIKQLVDSTTGLVIVDNNDKPIHSYYHACCGGATDDVRDIWQSSGEVYYLKGTKCVHCKSSPYYNWKFEIEKEKFNKILVSNDIKIGKIVSINILDKTSTGRVKNIELVGTKGTICLSANKFREVFGYNKIRSTKFVEIKIFSNNIIITGNGWGHGVGLCQWGANNLSLNGKKFKEIIQYYYPKTKIKKLYE